MASVKESNDEVEHEVVISDGESFELDDELRDKETVSSVDGDAKGKRKNSSIVWEHFVDIEVMVKGKKLKKQQCMHCKNTYQVSNSGTTSSLKRHLSKCAHYLKATGNGKGFLNFQQGGSDVASGFNNGTYEKFEKYWGETGVLMAIASVLDPRFKMLSLKWTFQNLYPQAEVNNRVEDMMSEFKTLFQKYSSAFETSKATTSTRSTQSTVVQCDFAAYVKSVPVVMGKKTELEVYLEDPNYVWEEAEESQFDVLKWWMQNSSKFPILSKMSRDIFGIPITTVASESAFSAGGRVLDAYRSSLSKDTVEMLVCGGDWLRASSKTNIHTFEDSVKEEEKLEIVIQSLTNN